MPSTSGSSEEIIRIGDALAGELGEQPVHLGLGADVDAAGGLVDDQQLGVGGQPLGETTFCWLPPLMVVACDVEGAGLHLEPAGPGAAAARSRRRGEEPERAQPPRIDAGDVAGAPSSR